MAVLVKLVLLPVFPLPREVVVEEGRSMSQSGTMDGAWEKTGQCMFTTCQCKKIINPWTWIEIFNSSLT